MTDGENPSDEQLTAAGFDLADDLDRPDRHCDCPKCKAFYDAIVAIPPASWAHMPDSEVLKIAPMAGNFSTDEVAAFCGGFRRCAQALAAGFTVVQPTSAVRVCTITDTECPRQCYSGPCKLEQSLAKHAADPKPRHGRVAIGAAKLPPMGSASQSACGCYSYESERVKTEHKCEKHSTAGATSMDSKAK